MQGEIVEGSESEIRAAFFILAVTREYDPATGACAASPREPACLPASRLSGE
jgi:hypothetical protein